MFLHRAAGLSLWPIDYNISASNTYTAPPATSTTIPEITVPSELLPLPTTLPQWVGFAPTAACAIHEEFAQHTTIYQTRRLPSL